MFKRWLRVDPKKSTLLIGPRRSGKTTFLKNNFPDHKYSTLDDYDFLSWANNDPKGFINHLGKRAIIDEIQRCPKLTIAVKYAIDNSSAQFMMSGSSSQGLLDATADSMAGRINIVSLPTACWGEPEGKAEHPIFKKKVNPAEINRIWRSFEDALYYGQFPEVVSQETIEEKKELLKNYKSTYFIRDIMQLANLENAEGLMAIFHHLARSIGSHLEVSKFARESGLSFPTTKKYLNSLNQSQLIFRLYGYQYGPAKRFLKSAKTYFSDNGIIYSLNVKLNIGQWIENFVLAELEKRRKLGFIETDQLYYYKSIGGNEIDCIFEANGTVNAIEIKASSAVGKKDLNNIKDYIKNSQKTTVGYLFYTGKEYKKIDGINIIPIAALYRGI